jgi:hypothetical protein
MHVSAQDFLLALAIGAEVFAIAALWPLSEWALKRPRRGALALAMGVVLACVALDTQGLAFGSAETGTLRGVIDWMVLPLFIVFPDAVCVASAQSLARAGLPARYARATALAIAAMAVMVAPFATMVARCGPGVCA